MNRSHVVVVSLVALTVASALPFVFAWSALPEPMASHWDLAGTPNGALPRALLLGLHVLAAAIATVAGLRVFRLEHEAPGSVGPAAGTCTWIASLFAGLAWVVVYSNLGVATWRDARPVTLPMVALLVVASAAAWLVSRSTRIAEPPRGEAPSAGLGAGERILYRRRTSSPVFQWVTAVCAAGAALGWIAGDVDVASTMAVVALVCAAFTSIAVQVDRRALTLSYGPFAFPRQTFELSRIQRADTLVIVPLAHGGWGYRGSLQVLGRAAVIVRGGPALELSLVGNKRLVITCDEPDQVAGIINDLNAR